MLELLQASLPTVTEPQWAWVADATDAEAKWGALVIITAYFHDVAKDYVAAWQSVQKARIRNDDP